MRIGLYTEGRRIGGVGRVKGIRIGRSGIGIG